MATEALKISLVVFGCDLTGAGRGKEEIFECLDANASGTFADSDAKWDEIIFLDVMPGATLGFQPGSGHQAASCIVHQG